MTPDVQKPIAIFTSPDGEALPILKNLEYLPPGFYRIEAEVERSGIEPVRIYKIEVFRRY